MIAGARAGHGVLELAQAAPHRAAGVGQALGSEDEQREAEDEQHLHGSERGHQVNLFLGIFTVLRTVLARPAPSVYVIVRRAVPPPVAFGTARSSARTPEVTPVTVFVAIVVPLRDRRALTLTVSATVEVARRMRRLLAVRRNAVALSAAATLFAVPVPVPVPPGSPERPTTNVPS